MDPTIMLALIRDMVESVNAGCPVDHPQLVNLVTGLDEWLCRGGVLPCQWTSPGQDHPVPHWDQWTAVLVTDPDRTLTEVRASVTQVAEGLDTDRQTVRLLCLLAGLDHWVSELCEPMPRQWAATR